MLKIKLALGALLLSCSSVAMAQTFPKPPDVPAFNDQTTGILYASGSTQNTTNNTEVTGVGLADIPTPNASAWTVFGTYDSSNGFKTIPTGTEKKFRTHVQATVVLNDDAIRAYCQPGNSHLHQFFGASRISACTTFSTLRGNQQKSFAAGGALNNTAYWMPAMLSEDAFGDGRTYVVVPDYITVYYAEDPTSTTIRNKLGQRYVTGFNMDDGDAWLQGKIDQANAQAGTAGRYQIANGGTKGTRTSFVCESTGQTVASLATSTGADPFSPTCPSSSHILVDFAGAKCWDRVNLWSPGGYHHIIPEIYDVTYAKMVCPNGWSRLAGLQVKPAYSHEGATGPRGYTKWRFSSDPIAPGANSGTINGQTVLRGQTFHTDWFGGWDLVTFNKWQDNCLGANGTTPHECDSGVFSATESLLIGSGGPSGRNPQVCLGCVNGTTTRAKMVAVPTQPVAGTGHRIHGITNKLKLTAQGDSITVNAEGAAIMYAANNGDVTVVNRAVGGYTLANVVSQQATVIADAPKVVTIGIGTNDLADTTTYPTTTAWLTTFDNHVAALRAQGIRVAVVSLIPQYFAGNATATTNFNSRRATVNAWFKAGVGARYDAYIDYTTNTCFDADADATVTTCYNADGTHPNSTGYAAQVPIYDGVVDGLFNKSP